MREMSITARVGDCVGRTATPDPLLCCRSLHAAMSGTIHTVH
jgi:hypothetical protein